MKEEEKNSRTRKRKVLRLCFRMFFGLFEGLRNDDREKESSVLTRGDARVTKAKKGEDLLPAGERKKILAFRTERTLHLYDCVANAIIAVDRSSENNTAQGIQKYSGYRSRLKRSPRFPLILLPVQKERTRRERRMKVTFA